LVAVAATNFIDYLSNMRSAYAFDGTQLLIK